MIVYTYDFGLRSIGDIQLCRSYCRGQVRLSTYLCSSRVFQRERERARAREREKPREREGRKNTHRHAYTVSPSLLHTHLACTCALSSRTEEKLTLASLLLPFLMREFTPTAFHRWIFCMESMCIYMCICRYTCVCIYIYIYTYIHTYIYTYMNICIYGHWVRFMSASRVKVLWFSHMCTMQVSSENATPPKSTNFKSSNSLVQIPITPNFLSQFVLRDTERL